VTEISYTWQALTSVTEISYTLTGFDISDWNILYLTGFDISDWNILYLTGFDISNWNILYLPGFDISDWNILYLTGFDTSDWNILYLTGFDISDWNILYLTGFILRFIYDIFLGGLVSTMSKYFPSGLLVLDPTYVIMGVGVGQYNVQVFPDWITCTWPHIRHNPASIRLWCTLDYWHVFIRYDQWCLTMVDGNDYLNKTRLDIRILYLAKIYSMFEYYRKKNNNLHIVSWNGTVFESFFL